MVVMLGLWLVGSLLLLGALTYEFAICRGCCSTCYGTGGGIWEPMTNGLCWDCRATGHGGPHRWGLAR